MASEAARAKDMKPDMAQWRQRSTNEIDKYKSSDTPSHQSMVTAFSCTAAYPKAYPSRHGPSACGPAMRKPSLKGPNPFEQARLASMASASRATTSL